MVCVFLLRYGLNKTSAHVFLLGRQFCKPSVACWDSKGTLYFINGKESPHQSDIDTAFKKRNKISLQQLHLKHGLHPPLLNTLYYINITPALNASNDLQNVIAGSCIYRRKAMKKDRKRKKRSGFGQVVLASRRPPREAVLY